MSSRSPAWRQYVDQPEDWANAHRWLLRAIFDLFDRDGEWPTMTALQRSLADGDTEHALSAGQLIIEMPGELGARHVDRVVLNARGLSHCDGAENLLDAFVAAIRMAAACYRNSDTQQLARVDDALLRAELGLNDQDLLKLIAVLECEPWAFGNGGGNPGEDWHRDVTVDALRFEGVETIGQYLEALARHRFGPPGEAETNAQTNVISLRERWLLGERIGGGGFANVYAARCGEREAVAKLIPKEPGADRELLLVELQDARNVVPVIDHGETDEHLVVIMPRASMSLRDHIVEAGPGFAAQEVRSILTQIATTLEDIEGRAVHRDIKPDNVLCLDGNWCLSDFGIARYAEASTAPDTRKYARTPEYAAPEQWRGKHAEPPVDVYALGVIGYELLAGALPFQGPDFGDQHLHDDPPPLEHEDLELVSVISDCLNKSADARPKPGQLLKRLASPLASLGPGLATLQRASSAQALQATQAARRLSQAQTAAERRAELFQAGAKKWIGLLDRFTETLLAAGAAITLSENSRGGRTLKLGQAELQIDPVAEAVETERASQIQFEVVGFAAMTMKVPQDRWGYSGRGHSLWFCDAQHKGEFSWFETAFMHNPLTGGMRTQDPFALSPGPQSAGAVGRGGTLQVAWPFMAIEMDSLNDFTERWADWLGKGSEGRLHRPSRMPEHNPAGSWRMG